MNRYSIAVGSLLWVVALVGCSPMPDLRAGGTDERAARLLDQAAQEQGAQALDRLRDVTVEFQGHWNPLIAGLQAKLVDIRFRGTSREQYQIHSPAEHQVHTGPGGSKEVSRDGTSIEVKYNGTTCTDPEARDAAALVADNYRMFLLGPLFFLQRGGIYQSAGTEQVDGGLCDNVLAELKPGLGNSREDRVLISIDRERHRVRRVRITMHGLESTSTAIVDVYLRDPIRIRGVLWPTRFDEELQRPFPAPVHHWRLTSIDFTTQPPDGHG